MACSIYNIESDKLFLCCNDIQVLEVYEIDSLYLAPVQRKHWTEIARLNFGEGREYKAIKVGDKEIIEGRDLERLMRELLSLGMMVNREGLCFLKQEVSSSSGEQVNYYRMFDKFDWSKYDLKVSVSTRWICSDIVTGRPMLDSFMQMLFEKVSQFAEAKDQHRSECMELKLKHIDDMEEFNRKHLAPVEQKLEDKSKVKEDELKESNIHQSDLQVLLKALETLAEVMEFKQFQYPSGRVRLQYKLPIKRNDWKCLFYEPDVCIVINDLNALVDLPSFPGLSYQGLSVEPKFDKDNWWAVRVVRVRPHAKMTNIDTLIYYDGGYSSITIPNAGSIPVPLRSTEFEYVSSGMFFYVAGVGVRYGFSVKDAVRERVSD